MIDFQYPSLAKKNILIREDLYKCRVNRERLQRKFRDKHSNFIIVLFAASLIWRLFSIYYCSSTAILDYELTYNKNLVNLPEAISVERIENKRLVYYVVLNNTGKLWMEGENVESTQVLNKLKEIKNRLSNVIICLHVDADCEMSKVQDFLLTARKAGTLRINFASRVKKPTNK